jgi:6-phosphogluconolactonase
MSDIYIGTYTRGDSKGIYRLQFDPETGALESKGVAAETQNPSFLAKHPTLPIIYAVAEMGLPQGVVTAFEIDAATGDLSELNHQSTCGKGPCHVTVAPGAKHIAVANYSSGSACLLPIREDGHIEESCGSAQHEGSSVNEARQKEAHAHSVNFDAAGRRLFVADLGMDKLMIYRYGPEVTDLPPNDPPFAELPPGGGPRHFAWHPSNKFGYVINEMGNTVSAFRYDADTGKLDPIQVISTLPEGYAEASHTAEVRVHPSGRFLYGSNRGHDSIAVFDVNADTGELIALGHTSTGGETPRNFNLDPSGSFLIAANQNTHNVVVFRISPEHGQLEPTGVEVEVPSPVCVLFA